MPDVCPQSVPGTMTGEIAMETINCSLALVNALARIGNALDVLSVLGAAYVLITLIDTVVWWNK